MRNMTGLTIVSIFLYAVVAAGSARGQEDAPRRRGMGPPLLTVTGSGHSEATPDRATVRIGAVAQAKQANEAQEKVNGIVVKTIEAIKELGIDEKAIRTAGLSVSPVYSNPPQQPMEREGINPNPHITAYRAANVVEVRVDDLSKLGQVIDAGVASGANNIDGVDFSLKDEGPQRREALARAARDAREKAEALAEAMSLRLEGVQEVTEGGVNVMPPRPYFGRAAMAAEAVSTPVEPGEIRTDASVTVSYRVSEPGRPGGPPRDGDRATDAPRDPNRPRISDRPRDGDRKTDVRPAP
jgi:uncharacterized protein YggE